MSTGPARGPGGAGAVVTLGGRLTLPRAAEIRAALLEALAAGGTVAIRFDAVDEADLTLLQIFCAAHREAAAAGRGLALAGTVPEAVAALAARSGAVRCDGGPPGCIVSGLLGREGR